MKIMHLVTVCIVTVIFQACAKSNIKYLIPSDEINQMTIESLIDNKTLSNEAKIQAIQIKMAEQLERDKKVVEMEKDMKLAAIIKQPVSPLRTPDTILRVLMLPYENDNGVLNLWQYSFIKVDDGKWIIADYLNGEGLQLSNTLTQLK